MREIDVSVIIPVYNAGALISRCLDSVFNQIGDYNIEVIIVDDGSTDNSIEIIKSRFEQDSVRLFQQKNSGPACARNKGMREARGKYIAFIDADDYWLPRFIDTTLNFINSHSECVAVSVCQRHITMDGDSEAPRNWNIISQGQSIVIEDFFNFWGQHNHICTGSILIKREVASSIGGMREDLRSCEDLEFWAMVATKGQVGFIPEILFVSDGNKVTKTLGWAKYKKRFDETKDFGVWFNRLGTHLSQKDRISASPRFNYIVLGITRSFICAGKFTEAYKNLAYYINLDDTKHYILKFASRGMAVWRTFSIFYRTYRYCKISYPYLKNKLGR